MNGHFKKNIAGLVEQALPVTSRVVYLLEESSVEYAKDDLDNDRLNLKNNASSTAFSKTYRYHKAKIVEVDINKILLEGKKSACASLADRNQANAFQDHTYDEKDTSFSKKYPKQTKGVLIKQKIFTCDQCTYACKELKVLIDHKQIHSEENPYACSLCDFTTRKIVNLKRHIRLHKTEKTFDCNQCSYSCEEATSLKTHKLVHQEEHIFACDECKYVTKKISNLTRHKRVHTGEKPFACNQCTYSCKDAGALKRHKLIHTGVNPFSCDQCKYTSKTVNDLKKHLRIHTGEKPFVCDQCTYACRQLYYLRMHKKHVHSDQLPKEPSSRSNVEEK